MNKLITIGLLAAACTFGCGNENTAYDDAEDDDEWVPITEFTVEEQPTDDLDLETGALTSDETDTFTAAAAGSGNSDLQVRPYEYPGATHDETLPMGSMTVHYYKTTDSYEQVTAHYAALEKFTGGEYGENEAAYSRTLVDGTLITATITSQPEGGCQIILSLTPPAPAVAPATP